MLLSEAAPTDDDEKVRRNLVAFSAAVVLLAWLGIPFSAIAEKLVGVAHPALNPLRTWTAGGAVLLYLAMRFHFTGGGKTAFDALTKLWWSNVHWQLDALMKREASAVSHQSWWTPSIAQAMNRAEDVFSKHGYSGEPLRTLQFRQDTSVNEARWTFVGGATMRVDFLNRNMSPPSIITHYTEDLRYKIPVGTAARVSARALWGTWLYSEEAVAWMFPIWLALAASGSLATG